MGSTDETEPELRQEADIVSIDGVETIEGTTYYSLVVHPDSSEVVHVLRRYSEFVALKEMLKKANKERFSLQFPPKLEVGRSRQAKLQTWLRSVVSAHGTDNYCVATFLV